MVGRMFWDVSSDFILRQFRSLRQMASRDRRRRCRVGGGVVNDHDRSCTNTLDTDSAISLRIYDLGKLCHLAVLVISYAKCIKVPSILTFCPWHAHRLGSNAVCSSVVYGMVTSVILSEPGAKRRIQETYYIKLSNSRKRCFPGFFTHFIRSA